MIKSDPHMANLIHGLYKCVGSSTTHTEANNNIVLHDRLKQIHYLCFIDDYTTASALIDVYTYFLIHCGLCRKVS